MIKRDPTVMMALPRSLQSDPVLRVVAYGSSKKLDMPTADAIMIFRDTPLKVLEEENKRWNQLVEDPGEGEIVLPEGYTLLSTDQLRDEHNAAKNVDDILDVILYNEEAVKRAVEKKGDILPFLGAQYAKNMECRLLACKTYPRAVLWVLKDLTKREEDVRAHGEAEWMARVRIMLSNVYEAVHNARILDRGPHIDDVESVTDGATMDYFSQLIGDIITIYTPDRRGERVEYYTDDELTFRLQIVALARQAQSQILRPDGPAARHAEGLGRLVGKEDDLSHTLNSSGLRGRVVSGSEVEARRDRLRIAFCL